MKRMSSLKEEQIDENVTNKTPSDMARSLNLSKHWPLYMYITNEEYREATGKSVDVQAEVEKPHVYIVGRCKRCEVEQLAYIETRLCCLRITYKRIWRQRMALKSRT